jgi:hypothetical protein
MLTEIQFPFPETQNEKLHAHNSLGRNPRERSAADDPSAVCGRLIWGALTPHICPLCMPAFESGETEE